MANQLTEYTLPNNHSSKCLSIVSNILLSEHDNDVKDLQRNLRRRAIGTKKEKKDIIIAFARTHRKLQMVYIIHPLFVTEKSFNNYGIFDNILNSLTPQVVGVILNDSSLTLRFMKFQTLKK